VSIASSRVIEVWKGGQELSGGTVTFTASSSIACDMSTATVGRLSVLFLERDKNQKAIRIAVSGRGQMLINEVDGKSYASLMGVILPKELESLDKLSPREPGKGILAVEDLKGYVVRTLTKRR
jgi:predicted house-cleaning NTP pyrophosphatase (Maf/HAM1 superfamily)